MKKSSTIDKILALAAQQCGVITPRDLYRRNWVRSAANLAELLRTQLAGLVEYEQKERGHVLRLTWAGWQRSGALDSDGKPRPGIKLDLKTLLDQLEDLAKHDRQAAIEWHAIRDYHRVVAKLDEPPSITKVIADLKRIWQSDKSREARKLARKTLKRLAPEALGDDYKDLRVKDEYIDPPTPEKPPHRIHKRTDEDLARFKAHLQRTGQQDELEPPTFALRPPVFQKPYFPPAAAKPQTPAYQPDVEEEYSSRIARPGGIGRPGGILRPGGR